MKHRPPSPIVCSFDKVAEAPLVLVDTFLNRLIPAHLNMNQSHQSLQLMPHVSTVP